MQWSSSTMVLRQCTAHIEPFDGSPEMLSIRESVEERAAAGHTRVILTARVATGPAWSTIIVFPPGARNR
jgi:hypothetical protein